jgi:hypothetical protein
MSDKLRSFVVAVFFATCCASAEDTFPGQPQLSVAYSRVTAAARTLNLALRRSGDGVTTANGYLGEGKDQLEASPKAKGSACVSAIKLIDQARQGLSGPTATLPEIVKALESSKEALKLIAIAAKEEK